MNASVAPFPKNDMNAFHGSYLRETGQLNYHKPLGSSTLGAFADGASIRTLGSLAFHSGYWHRAPFWKAASIFTEEQLRLKPPSPLASPLKPNAAAPLPGSSDSQSRPSTCVPPQADAIEQRRPHSGLTAETCNERQIKSKLLQMRSGLFLAFFVLLAALILSLVLTFVAAFARTGS